MIGFEDITVENYVSVRNADQMKGHQVNLYESRFDFAMGFINDYEPFLAIPDPSFVNIEVYWRE